jgi:hypothetical protein
LIGRTAVTPAAPVHGHEHTHAHVGWGLLPPPAPLSTRRATMPSGRGPPSFLFGCCQQLSLA